MINLPSKDDIVPHGIEDLDAKSALNFFHNKTLDEVKEEYSQFPLDVAEHFMWVGPKAFDYYIQSITDYLESPDSEDDELAVVGIVSTLKFLGEDILNKKYSIFKIQELAKLISRRLEYYGVDESSDKLYGVTQTIQFILKI